MVSRIEDFFRNRDFRKRLFVTLGAIAVYRLCAYIPLPGIHSRNLNLPLVTKPTLLAVFTRHFPSGGLGDVSIVSMGIEPYFNAWIIMTLTYALAHTFPRFYKREAHRFKQHVTYLSFFMAMFQSVALTIWISKAPALDHVLTAFRSARWFCITFLALIAVAMFVVWLAEQITTRGIGNGMAVFLLLGIFEQLPGFVRRYAALPETGGFSIFRLTYLIASALAIAVLAIWLLTAQYRIPILGGKNASVSFKLVPWGVDAVLAISLAGTFMQVALDLTDFMPHAPLMVHVREFLHRESLSYSFVAAGFVAFFFHSINKTCVDQREMAKHLRASNASFTTVSPPKPAAAHLEWVFDRINFGGAISAFVICVLPDCIATALGMPPSLLGFWVLLIVSLALAIIHPGESSQAKVGQSMTLTL